MKTVPRGVRNNNPFNIRKTDADKWQGLSAQQNDPDFCQFDEPIYGIRAGMRNLIAAQDKHGRTTISTIIAAYAPSVENNTNAYIVAVSQYMGVGSSAVLDMHSYSDLRSLSEAIIAHENGGSWSDYYSDSQMTKACVLAGVEPPKKSLAQSRQMIGGAIAATATAAAPVVQQAQISLQGLTDYSEYVKHAFLGVALLGIVLAMWAKYDERKKGIS